MTREDRKQAIRAEQAIQVSVFNHLLPKGRGEVDMTVLAVSAVKDAPGPEVRRLIDRLNDHGLVAYEGGDTLADADALRVARENIDHNLNTGARYWEAVQDTYPGRAPYHGSYEPT